jgi:hypothetical protein
MSKLIVLVACASCATPPSKPPAAPTAGVSASMILVDALVFEVAPGRLAATTGKTADELAKMPGVTMLTHPSQLVVNRERGEFSVGCTPPTTCAYYAMRFTPEILADDNVRLDTEIHGDVYMHANTVIRKGQMVEVEATRPVAPTTADSTVLVQLRARVVHDIAELRRLHPTGD